MTLTKMGCYVLWVYLRKRSCCSPQIQQWIWYAQDKYWDIAETDLLQQGESNHKLLLKMYVGTHATSS